MFAIRYQYDCIMFDCSSQWSALASVIRLEEFFSFASFVVLFVGWLLRFVHPDVFECSWCRDVCVLHPASVLPICMPPPLTDSVCVRCAGPLAVATAVDRSSSSRLLIETAHSC